MKNKPNPWDRKNIKPSDCPLADRGIDLNRNYGYKWGYDDIGSSIHPCREEYRGLSAFSELETQAIKKLVELYHFDSVISYHSYGDLYIIPTGYIFSEMNQFPLSHQSLYNEIKKILPKNIRFGSVQELLNYSANGAFMDYLYSLGIFSIEVEMAPENYNSFHPDYIKVDNILKDHLNPFLVFISKTISKLSANVTTDWRKLFIYIENQGIAKSNSVNVHIKFDKPIKGIRMLSKHPIKEINNTFIISIPRIDSDSVDILKMLIDTQSENNYISVTFSPLIKGYKEFYGEISFTNYGDSSSIVLIIIICLLIVASLCILIGWYAYKKRLDTVRFVELEEVKPRISA